MIKRVSVAPIAKVVVVKFISCPPRVHNYISVLYHSDTKLYHSSPDCVRKAAQITVEIITVAVTKSAIIIW